jgi:hypothetical protein
MEPSSFLTTFSVELVGGFRCARDSWRLMEIPTNDSFAQAPGRAPRTLTALLLEGIALRHQIAALQHRNLMAQRNCFRR